MSTSAIASRATALSWETSSPVTPTKVEATRTPMAPALLALMLSAPPSVAPGPPTRTSAEPSPIRATLERVMSTLANSTSKPVTSDRTPASTSTSTVVTLAAETETAPETSSVAPPRTSARVIATTVASIPPSPRVASASMMLAVLAKRLSEPARIVELAPTCTVAEALAPAVWAGEAEPESVACAVASALSVTAPEAVMSPSTTTEAVAEAEAAPEPEVAASEAVASSVTKLIAPLAPTCAASAIRMDSASTSREPV